MNKHSKDQAVECRVKNACVDETGTAADNHACHHCVEDSIESIDKGPMGVKTITLCWNIQTAEVISNDILVVTLHNNQGRWSSIIRIRYTGVTSW